MAIIFKIAFRNLREHRAKTLIIGSIVIIGAFTLVLGNSLLDTVESGIREMYTRNFTGDIVIASSRNASRSLFSSGAGIRKREPPAVIRDSGSLLGWLSERRWAECASPQVTSTAIAGFDEGAGTVIQLFGVDPVAYLSMFPDTVELISGRFIAAGETGLVLPESVAGEISKISGKDIVPGSRILLTSSAGLSGTKVREVEVRGVFRFRKSAPNLSNIVYADLTTTRVLSGMNRVVSLSSGLTEEESSSLGQTDEESLFGGDGGIVSPSSRSSASDIASVEKILADRTDADALNAVDPDSCRDILVRVKSGKSVAAAIRELNEHFRAEGLELEAYEWGDAAGQTATIVIGMKSLFNALAAIIGVVAAIIVMNTLVISITERIGEIGTMRAIGAGKNFVRWMISLETLMISTAFGIVGILLGLGAVLLIGALGISSTDPFMQVFLGGSVFRPAVSAGAVSMSLASVIIVGGCASLYPVSIALKIKPVRAMAR